MSVPKTVIINCAGVGSRLGLGVTKALIEIKGKPIIAWHLEMLKEVDDVRIVVGYQSSQLINQVLKIRNDITFVFNRDYLTTGTATSLVLGASHAKGLVISLDGDLLVHPDDFQFFLDSNEECVGYCLPTTENPVLLDTTQYGLKEMVTSFSRDKGKYEWTGLVQINMKKLKPGTEHVYQVLEPYLPINAIPIRCQEIDTPKDYETAIEWVEKHL